MRIRTQPLDAPHGGRPGHHRAQGAAVVGGQGVAVHGGGEQDAAAGVHRHVQRYRRAEINAGRVYVCACELSKLFWNQSGYLKNEFMSLAIFVVMQ